MIHGTGGRNLIFGGHGNDVISDGDGSSTVHSGPGRNRISLGGGNDVVHVGTGVNHVDPGTGAVRFVIAYGGVTHVSGWDAAQVYDLSLWPAPPNIRRRGNGDVEFSLGLSLVRISGVPPEVSVEAQMMRGPTPEVSETSPR